MTTGSDAAVRFGENIRSTRSALGYSAREASRLSHIDMSHYTRIERGEANATLHVLLRISHSLETTPAVLLDGIDSGGLPVNGPTPLTRDEFTAFTRAVRAKKDEQ